MTHRRVPGSAHALIHDLITAAGGSKAVALHLGKHASDVSAWASADRPANKPALSLERTCDLAMDFPEAAAVLARHFAALAGGSFEPGCDGADLEAAIVVAHRESAEATAAALSGRDLASVAREAREAGEAHMNVAVLAERRARTCAS